MTQNVQDPNTDAEKARKITLTIDFKPSKSRDYASTKVSVKTALAPVISIETGMVMGKNLETGDVEVYEFGNTIPGQMLMRVSDQDGNLDIVDMDTGEIVKQDNIIDLRNVK